MDYRVTCACGQAVAVAEGAAGSAVPCPCGRTVAVPSLRQLRRLNRVADPINPVLVIRQMLAAGELPPGRECARCGRADAPRAEVTVQVEMAWVRRRGRWDWLVLVAGAALTCVSIPVAIAAAVFRATQPGDMQTLGQDVAVTLPIRLCPACRAEVRTRHDIEDVLREVPVYARLLDRYPGAGLGLPEPEKD